VAPRADNTVSFRVEGPGEIVATDNGDPTSFVPFRATVRPAFNGYAVAILRGRAGHPGTLSVTASADGLTGDRVTIRTTVERPPAASE
jgi:beta-galactosidase